MTRPLRRIAGPVGAIVAMLSIAAGCGGAVEVSAPDVLAVAPTSTVDAEPASTADNEPTSTADAEPRALARLEVQVLGGRPHDRTAFTQGLVFDGARLFESRGRVGASAVTEIDPATGAVLRRRDFADPYFIEGLAVVGDRLVVLTWKNKVALVLDKNTFETIDEFSYPGQGWGLCFDGEALVMSDGTAELEWRDPESFDVLRTVTVTLADEALPELNELECVGDLVYANIWRQDAIVAIDPATGAVTQVIDARGLLSDEQAQTADVLNGIAYDPAADTFLITGKYWPAMFEAQFVPERAR